MKLQAVSAVGALGDVNHIRRKEDKSPSHQPWNAPIGVKSVTFKFQLKDSEEVNSILMSTSSYIDHQWFGEMTEIDLSPEAEEFNNNPSVFLVKYSGLGILKSI